MWQLHLLPIFILLASESSALLCGTRSDVTNLNTVIIAGSTTLRSRFSYLDTSCFSKTKSTLLNLQAAVNEGKKCDAQATILLTKLDRMCRFLKPLGGFAAKFDRVLKILKLFHKNLDKITKFADYIPRVGQLRKLIVEKVIPMALNIMEILSKQVRKVIDYERILLKYEKSAKLLWKIDKYGSKVCKLSSPLGVSLRQLKSTIQRVNKPSIIILKTTNLAQRCMTRYCRSKKTSSTSLRRRSSCSECNRAETGFTAVNNTVTAWRTKMVQCNDKLSGVNKILSKLNVVTSVMGIAEKIFSAIETFLSPVSDKLSKFANTIGKITSKMMSCCPCGRPNMIGCSLQAIKKTIDLISCPLDGLTNFAITKFLRVVKDSISKLVSTVIPKISVDINLPAVNFRIDLRPFLQNCFRQTIYRKGFTKFCSLSSRFRLTISTSFKTERSSITSSSSLSSHIRSSCRNAVSELKKLGRNLRNCFDSASDILFAIPGVGFIAALTCDSDKDPDPNINYCPCKSSSNNCVVVHRSRDCTRTCRSKRYSPGKDPSGKTKLMYTTKGYPFCDKMKYYCKKGNVRVKNGRVSCKNAYTHLGGSCNIIPKRGYVCPISHIHCGIVSRGKSVCWDYKLIECTRDDGKSFPMCTCRNRDNGGFTRGEVVCQAGGSSSSSNLLSLKEIRKSVSCFRPLGRYSNIKTDCGKNMHPCVVQKPPIDAYEACSSSSKRPKKIWYVVGKQTPYRRTTIRVQSSRHTIRNSGTSNKVFCDSEMIFLAVLLWYSLGF